MKGFILFFLLLSTSILANNIHVCDIGTNGKGNKQVKRVGGNYCAIKIADLKGYELIFQRLDGTVKYITAHERFSNGTWRTTYTGPMKALRLKDIRKTNNSTHINLSVNGAHERYEAIKSKVRVYKRKIVSHNNVPKLTGDYIHVCNVTTDGKGNNQVKRVGGTYCAIKVQDLKGYELVFQKVYGPVNYLTAHERFSNGTWRTTYQGGLKVLRLKDIRKTNSSTHINFSVNGAHEKYQAVKSKVRIYKRKINAHHDNHSIISGAEIHVCDIMTDGRGTKHRKRIGGNYCAIKIADLKGYELVFKRVHGPIKYLTAHERFANGTWRTTYTGGLKVLRLKDIRKTNNSTHINFSVNGAHEKYEPIKSKVKIYKRKIVSHNNGIHVCDIATDGKGNPRRKRIGGNYCAIKIADLQGYELVFKTVYGPVKYITAHERFSNGTWRTTYQGPTKILRLKDIRKTNASTHINFSVNGAHEKYEPIKSKVKIYKRKILNLKKIHRKPIMMRKAGSR